MSDSITVPVIDLAQMEDPCGRKRGLDTVLHAVRDFGLFYVIFSRQYQDEMNSSSPPRTYYFGAYHVYTIRDHLPVTC